jgi:methionyl-tRNA formyltransferase
MSFICIAGKNKIAINGIELLLKIGVKKTKILACVNKTDDGIDTWQPSYKKYCIQNEVRIVEIQDLFQIKNLIFISLEFDQIINPDKFISNQLYNIHFSKLPFYKGMYTSILPLLHGESTSGVTLHLIDKGIDTGDIIDQIEFHTSNITRGIDLYFMYLDFGLKLLQKNIESILNNKIIATPQTTINSTYFSKKFLSFSNLEINFFMTAYQIHNFVRAFTFRPYQLISFNNIPLSHTFITQNKSKDKPGTIVNFNEIFFEVSTIDFNIILYRDLLVEILNAAKNDNLTFIFNLNKHGYFLEDKNSKGWNALIVSAFNESKNVFDYLIQLGCNINVTNNNGTSLFMYSMTKACESNDNYFVKRLLELDVNRYHKDNFNKDAFEYCKKLNNNSIYKLITNV